MNHFAHRIRLRPVFATITLFLLLFSLMPVVALTARAASIQTDTPFRPWSPPHDMSMTPGKAPAAILRVPEEFATIQAAVNAAKPYDLISIAPGVYHEAVSVRTAHLTLRGRDRNGVILDGNFALDDGVEVLANGVVIENMTARHFVGNGFYWTDVTVFAGVISQLTRMAITVCMLLARIPASLTMTWRLGNLTLASTLEAAILAMPSSRM